MTLQEDWARCRDWIKAAVEENGFYTIEWVEAEIESGHLTVWTGEQGIALTEFIQYPMGKALNIFAAAGAPNASLRELLDKVEPQIAAFAKAAGCRWVLGYGRPGFQRECKSMGYRPKWIVIAKEL